jgi:hypothetical protein
MAAGFSENFKLANDVSSSSSEMVSAGFAIAFALYAPVG